MRCGRGEKMQAIAEGTFLLEPAGDIAPPAPRYSVRHRGWPPGMAPIHRMCKTVNIGVLARTSRALYNVPVCRGRPVHGRQTARRAGKMDVWRDCVCSYTASA